MSRMFILNCIALALPFSAIADTADFMLGVDAGLSYFPSSKIGDSLTFDQLRAVIDQIAAPTNLRAFIAETAYPSTSDFSGQFAGWRTEVPGYALTAEGQQHWLADFLKLCRESEHIAGAFYRSPEWYGEGMWKAFALFDLEGNAKPAWKAFAQ